MIALGKSSRYAFLTLFNCDLILFDMLYFWNHLAYLGIHDRPFNCHASLNLVSRDLFRAWGVLPPRGTFPISNLIPGFRLGFFKDTLFQKLWSHFLGFYFLFYFPFKNKNKISGDSNFLKKKINFSQIKSESRRLSGDACEKCGSTAIFFTKEQFNARLRFPLPLLFKEFLHFTQIPPAYIHPNMVRVLMGCNILSMLFNLDLSLLEVLFIYSIKKGKNDIFSFVASLPFLQFVTSLPDLTKGVARGHVLVKGLWAGLSVHPDRQFAPNQSLKVPGTNMLLPVLPWLRVRSALLGGWHALFSWV